MSSTPIIEQGQWREGEQPPPAKNQKGGWDDVIAALQNRPGEWMSFSGQIRSKPSWLAARHPGLIAQGRDHYRDDAGAKRCEMWLMWPVDVEPEDDGEVEDDAG